MPGLVAHLTCFGEILYITLAPIFLGAYLDALLEDQRWGCLVALLESDFLRKFLLVGENMITVACFSSGFLARVSIPQKGHMEEGKHETHRLSPMQSPMRM